MSPENPNNTKSTEELLKEKMERLKKHINESNAENPSKEFETETGFKCMVSFFNGDVRNVILDDNGLVSSFSIQRNGEHDYELHFVELRGPDEEVMADPKLIKHHKNEAQRLLDEGRLDKVEPIREQFELDV